MEAGLTGLGRGRRKETQVVKVVFVVDSVAEAVLLQQARVYGLRCLCLVHITISGRVVRWVAFRRSLGPLRRIRFLRGRKGFLASSFLKLVLCVKEMLQIVSTAGYETVREDFFLFHSLRSASLREQHVLSLGIVRWLGQVGIVRWVLKRHLRRWRLHWSRQQVVWRSILQIF